MGTFFVIMYLGDNMYEVAINLLKEINELGYEAYIVGGYPRDLYMNKINTDIDICTNIKEELLKSNFDVISSTQFGSFVVKKGYYNFEITLFRKELYLNNRYPEVTYVDSLEEDLKRRDFIINTLCIDYNGNYVDLLAARSDIDNKIIRVVGNIEKKMTEDPLRIIRAIRFASDLDFKIEEELIKYIKNNSMLLNNLSKNRILKEIDKVENKINFYNLIKQLDLIDYIQ